MSVNRYRIGELRHRLTFESRTQDTDDLGGVEDTFGSPSFDVWAAESADRGSGRWDDPHEINRAIGEFIVRFRTDIEPGMRIVDGDNHYYVDSLLPLDNRRRYLRVIYRKEL